MFGFHALSKLPISFIQKPKAAPGTGQAFLGSKFGFDNGFSTGFESGTPVSLSGKSVLVLAGASSLAKGFGLNADGSLIGDLSAAPTKEGASLLQSDSIFSSKGVLLSVGKANLAGSGRLSVYSGISELSIVLYIDRERGVVNYLDIGSDFTLHIDKELNKTLSIDQGSSRTSYIDKELLMEI